MLKKIARDAGIIVPLYTVTGWGNAAVLENETIPVTAAYPYPFWEKPSMSNMFLFKDIQKYPDYAPVRYNGEDYPSICAEMGAGIQITYARRPQVPAKAAEALMIRSLGSGANGIGYYMYHGGLTPQHKNGVFLSDEAMGVPKISYDFQAPIGEYGKVRDSYFSLRLIHLFTENFAPRLAPMSVVLPETNAGITPDDRNTLRYSVRTDGKSGFVFMHNFQDHDERFDQTVSKFTVRLHDETIQFPAFTLKKDVSVILAFNMPVGESLLKYATVQPLAVSETCGKQHYFFFAHNGIPPEMIFNNSSVRKISGRKNIRNGNVHIIPQTGLKGSFTLTDKSGKEIIITVLSRDEALQFNQWEYDNQLLYCMVNAAVIQNGNHVQLQSQSNVFSVVLPASTTANFNCKAVKNSILGIFMEHVVETPAVSVNFKAKEINTRRFIFSMNKEQFHANLSDIILDIDYLGDVGMAFINGKMINDNLYYGNHWQIGLKQYASELDEYDIYFYFKPLNKNASYMIDFAKDKIPVFDGNSICKVNHIKVIPEYKIDFNIK
jgi:hypothetical protein